MSRVTASATTGTCETRIYNYVFEMQYMDTMDRVALSPDSLTLRHFDNDSSLLPQIQVINENENYWSMMAPRGFDISKRGDAGSGYYGRFWYNGIYTEGDLLVGGTKSRVVNTDQYADRLLYCYETTSPMFGDVGEGVIGEDGLCYVTIDPVFAQTIATNAYQVFLQRYGDGDCYVKERRGGWFVVSGTPGLPFGWEIKAKQRDYDQRRIDRNDEPFTVPAQSYGADAAAYITDLKKGRISA